MLVSKEAIFIYFCFLLGRWFSEEFLGRLFSNNEVLQHA